MCGENKYFKIRVGFRIGATVLKYRHAQLEYKTALDITCRHGGLMGSACDRAIRVQALAGDTVLCSWTRHLTLTVPL